METTNTVNYYSIICPKYDKDFMESDCDQLFQVRKDFFTTGKKQKNKITKEIANKIYHYAYTLENGQPMRWKRMLNEKVIEKSRINSDGSYEILFFNNNRQLSKIIYFDALHNIKKIEYLFANKESRRKALTLVVKQDELFVTEYKNDANHTISYKVYQANNYKNDVFDNKFTIFSCKTNKGTITYCTKEQITILENMKKSEIIEKNIEISQSNEKLENKNSVLESKCELSEISKTENKTCSNSDEKPSLTYKKIIKTENNQKFYYFGEMTDSARNGSGVTLTEHGTPAYIGGYLNDKKDGFGVFCNEFGKICYVGNFNQDKKHNLGITFDKKQNKIVISVYKEGELQSIVAEFDDSGRILHNIVKNEKSTIWNLEKNEILNSQLSFDVSVLSQNNAVY